MNKKENESKKKSTNTDKLPESKDRTNVSESRNTSKSTSKRENISTSAETSMFTPPSTSIREDFRAPGSSGFTPNPSHYHRVDPCSYLRNQTSLLKRRLIDARQSYVPSFTRSYGSPCESYGSYSSRRPLYQMPLPTSPRSGYLESSIADSKYGRTYVPAPMSIYSRGARPPTSLVPDTSLPIPPLYEPMRDNSPYYQAYLKARLKDFQACYRRSPSSNVKYDPTLRRNVSAGQQTSAVSDSDIENVESSIDDVETSSDNTESEGTSKRSDLARMSDPCANISPSRWNASIMYKPREFDDLCSTYKQEGAKSEESARSEETEGTFETVDDIHDSEWEDISDFTSSDDIDSMNRENESGQFERKINREPTREENDVKNKNQERHELENIGVSSTGLEKKLNDLFQNDSTPSISDVLAPKETLDTDKSSNMKAGDKSSNMKAGNKSGNIKAGDKSSNTKAGDKSSNTKAGVKSSNMKASDKSGNIKADDTKETNSDDTVKDELVDQPRSLEMSDLLKESLVEALPQEYDKDIEVEHEDKTELTESESEENDAMDDENENDGENLVQDLTTDIESRLDTILEELEDKDETVKVLSKYIFPTSTSNNVYRVSCPSVKQTVPFIKEIHLQRCQTCPSMGQSLNNIQTTLAFRTPSDGKFHNYHVPKQTCSFSSDAISLYLKHLETSDYSLHPEPKVQTSPEGCNSNILGDIESDIIRFEVQGSEEMFAQDLSNCSSSEVASCKKTVTFLTDS